MSKFSQLLMNEYVMVRTYSAGVFVGKMVDREGDAVELHDSRRIWYWEGAATLSQLAEEGVKSAAKCKFPQEMEQQILFNVIEIIKVQPDALDNIKKVPIWRAD